MKKSLCLALLVMILMLLTSCVTRRTCDLKIATILSSIPAVPQAPNKLTDMHWEITNEGLFTLPREDAYRLADWYDLYDSYLYDMETFKQQLELLKKN